MFGDHDGISLLQVRSRAQSSIDSVNQRYKADKAQLEANLQLAQGGGTSPKGMHSMHSSTQGGPPMDGTGFCLGSHGPMPIDDNRHARFGGGYQPR